MKSRDCSIYTRRPVAGGPRKVPAPEKAVAVSSSPRMTMSVEEMGMELGISRATAYELSQKPGFPSFSIGRRVLVSRDGLQKWIAQQYSGTVEILQTDEE